MHDWIVAPELVNIAPPQTTIVCLCSLVFRFDGISIKLVQYLDIYNSSVSFENNPDPHMHYWIMSLELVKITTKQLVYSLNSPFLVWSTPILFHSYMCTWVQLLLKPSRFAHERLDYLPWNGQNCYNTAFFAILFTFQIWSSPNLYSS